MAAPHPRLLAALGLSAALLGTGCERPASTMASTTDYFPLESGRHWVYAETITRDDGRQSQRTLRLDNLGRDTLEGLAAWHRRSDDGMHYWLRSDDSGVYRVASRFETEAFYTPDRPPRYVLRQPLRAGTEWQADTVPYLLERTQGFPRELRHSHPALPMHYRIEAGDEGVDTAAGRFEHCLRVRGTAALRLYADPVTGWQDLPLTSLEWYCPGAGLVRLQRQEPAAGRLLSGGQLSLELQP